MKKEDKMDNNELNIETISPIVFDPLQYYAEIETEDGKTKMIPVYHQKLAGVYLPKTIDNPQELLRSWEKNYF